jgi:hypothetical protein
VISDAGCNHALAEQVRHIIAGAQDVGDDQLERPGGGDIAYGLRHIYGGVIGLGEEQRNDNRLCVASLGQLAYGSAEVRFGQIEVRRPCGDPRLLGNGCHEPLDAAAALGMPAAVGKPDQRGM